MNTLIFATNNAHKVREIRAALPPGFHIISLQEAGIHEDIPEPHDSLEANATEKSTVIYQLTGQNCFSEDSGLEIEALKGAPGVLSARYALQQPEFVDNMDKVLHEMAGEKNRAARFKTVISLILNGQETRFEGICPGKIDFQKTGNQGFGYDPIFIPQGSSCSFGTMSLEEKQEFSHRKKAVEKLVLYLTNHILK